MKTIELTEEQVFFITESIRKTCRDIERCQLELNKPIYDNHEQTVKIRESLLTKKLKYQTLLNYIEQV